MINTESTIAVVNSNSSGITITLESTGIFLGILLSVSALAGLGIKVVSNVSKISSSITQIEEDLKEYRKYANINTQQITDICHRLDSIPQIEEELKEYRKCVNTNAEKIIEISHRLDLHIQDYVNSKDTITLLIGGIKEMMEHRTNRLYSSMKDIESYLQKNGTFKIREFQDLHRIEEDNPFDKL
ncbi:hypothetical protein [uncultured Nostoc sp.]|uniref:hypothetical protein n=1 Tax=uncultured Nostoc sp. TaxID=340711 RepID=UPI0035CBC075